MRYCEHVYTCMIRYVHKCMFEVQAGHLKLRSSPLARAIWLQVCYKDGPGVEYQLIRLEYIYIQVQRKEIASAVD